MSAPDLPVVVVCALCRGPLGVGDKAAVVEPGIIRRALAAAGRPPDDVADVDDEPVLVCVPCAWARGWA